MVTPHAVTSRLWYVDGSGSKATTTVYTAAERGIQYAIEKASQVAAAIEALTDMKIYEIVTEISYINPNPRPNKASSVSKVLAIVFDTDVEDEYVVVTMPIGDLDYDMEGNIVTTDEINNVINAFVTAEIANPWGYAAKTAVSLLELNLCYDKST